MIVTIHQPEHLPWLGFLDKVDHADILVLLDDVQFTKNYFHNRNRIRGKGGFILLTVPVCSSGTSRQRLNTVRIANDNSRRWRRKHWSSLQQCYQGARFWAEHQQFFECQYATEHVLLAELNEIFIRYLVEAFGISTTIVRSSTLGCAGLGKTETLVAICQKLGASTYLSGISGREYLDRSCFERAGIALEFQNFRHPVYSQRHQPFLPCMSSVDLLFNYGPESLGMLRGIGIPTLDEVFE